MTLALPLALALFAATTTHAAEERALPATGEGRRPEHTDSLDALVGRIAKAYGGEKALSGVHVVRETGTVESPRGVARTLRVFASPDRLRVEIQYEEGGGETRVLDGPHGYRNGERVSGPPRDAMVLQAARLDLPALLLRTREKLVDLGDVVRDGRKLRGIGVPLEGGLNVAIGVDPKSARIVHSEGALPGMGGGMRFATVYSDFRDVEGVTFAFHEDNFAGGQRTGETRFDRIEILKEAPEGSFAPGGHSLP
ncbi:MAG: hypothetical protein ACJ79O_15440 [Myxococcales bacterium]